MRFAGRISNWNDEKGYGFVSPVDGGERAFVHIKAFQVSSRRPADGDLISYEVTKDARGRTNAANIRFAGHRVLQPRTLEPRPAAKPLPIPRALIGSVALLLVFAGAWYERVPMIVPVVCVVLSVLSFLSYWTDKTWAQEGKSRIPEANLHAIDLLGGWPGGLIAQQMLRHKVSKPSFQTKTCMAIAANLAILTWLVHSGYLQGFL